MLMEMSVYPFDYKLAVAARFVCGHAGARHRRVDVTSDGDNEKLCVCVSPAINDSFVPARESDVNDTGCARRCRARDLESARLRADVVNTRSRVAYLACNFESNFAA